MKNFYEIDSQIVDAEHQLDRIRKKFEGIVWVKYIAIAAACVFAGTLIVMLPFGLILAALNWLVGLFGGDIPTGSGTIVGVIGQILSWVGILGGLGFAVWAGITGANGLEQQRAQLQDSLDDLRRQRSNYLRSSTD